MTNANLLAMTPKFFAPRTIHVALWSYPENLDAVDAPVPELSWDKQTYIHTHEQNIMLDSVRYSVFAIFAFVCLTVGLLSEFSTVTDLLQPEETMTWWIFDSKSQPLNEKWFLDCIECMRCRLLLPMIAVSVCQSVMWLNCVWCILCSLCQITLAFC